MADNLDPPHRRLHAPPNHRRDEIFLHEAARIHGGGGDRNPNRPRRLPVRVRRRSTPPLHLRLDNRVAAGVHGAVRLPPREAEVHGVLGKLGGAADAGGGGAGTPHRRRSAGGESTRTYWFGFVMTVAAAALYGFVLPLVEVTYKNAKQALTFTLVLEIQLVMCFFATAFCTVGMIFNHDFQAIAREAKAFELGETQYYIVLVFSAISWQCFFLGAIGVVFYSSSLLSGIIIAVLLPVTEVLAVIFYHEKFQVEKGISLFLSLWGFISYFAGEIKYSNNNNKEEEKNNQNQATETQLASQLSGAP
ncbi:hypothetical protein DH2020_016382 [Rehmannia glutinosa]|uniref:Probable purine permease n=1 Tax=Rehmannia glutinosa TaxID=99300 RepID=A0ABR0WR96_REHGL